MLLRLLALSLALTSLAACSHESKKQAPTPPPAIDTPPAEKNTPPVQGTKKNDVTSTNEKKTGSGEPEKIAAVSAPLDLALLQQAQQESLAGSQTNFVVTPERLSFVSDMLPANLAQILEKVVSDAGFRYAKLGHAAPYLDFFLSSDHFDYQLTESVTLRFNSRFALQQVVPPSNGVVGYRIDLSGVQLIDTNGTSKTIASCQPLQDGSLRLFFNLSNSSDALVVPYQDILAISPTRGALPVETPTLPQSVEKAFRVLYALQSSPEIAEAGHSVLDLKFGSSSPVRDSFVKKLQLAGAKDTILGVLSQVNSLRLEQSSGLTPSIVVTMLTASYATQFNSVDLTLPKTIALRASDSTKLVFDTSFGKILASSDNGKGYLTYVQFGSGNSGEPALLIGAQGTRTVLGLPFSGSSVEKVSLTDL